jgi:hypothetical protein
VAIADLTGDGIPDIATANRLGNSVSVLPGLGNGKFGARTDFPAGMGSRALAVGDLDHDGHPDVVTADETAGTVSVLMGGPGGVLGPASAHPVGALPQAIAVADMDGDGHLDVVVADNGSADVEILKGNGAGGLGPAHSYATAPRPMALAVADLNGDGWPDVVTFSGTPSSYNGGNIVSVLLNDRAGGLLPAVTYVGNVISGPRGLAIGDVTGDGIPDVVTADRLNGSLFRGSGNGSLTQDAAPTPGFQSRDVKLADLDGDGRLDLLQPSDIGASVYVSMGGVGGAFGPQEGYGAGFGPSALAVADLNGDGVTDAVVADGDTDEVSVLLGVSSGPVPALAAVASVDATPEGVRLVWLASSGPGFTATVYREEPAGDWSALGLVVSDGSGQLTFEDRNVHPGTTYEYRLGQASRAGVVFFAQVTVQVPLVATLSLAGARPNPSRGAVEVSFSLPDAAPARLEMFDVTGRRLLDREVGSMGPGAHLIVLEETRSLASGLYWLRMVRSDRTLVARAALVH